MIKKFLFVTIFNLMTIILNAQWNQVNNGLSNYVFGAMTAVGNDVFVAGGTAVVYKSSNNGGVWTPSGSGLSGIVNSLETDGSNIFAGSSLGIFRSSDNGGSWSSFNTGLSNVFVNSIIITNGNIFCGTNGGVFLSTNNGTNWINKNSGFPPNAVVKCFTTDGTYIYAGTNGYGVYYTNNNGNNWVAINNGLPTVPNSIINTLHIQGSNLYAGTDGNGIFISSNNGTNWVASNNGLTSNYIYAIESSGLKLFAGINAGIFSSTDNGISWTDIGSGLTGTFVTQIAMNPTNIFAALTNNGIWTRNLSEVVSVNEIQNAKRKIMIYPNPNNGKFEINIDGLEFGFISVYNSLGKLVSNLKSSGPICSIDISHMPKGIYFLTIMSNNNISYNTRLIVDK